MNSGRKVGFGFIRADKLARTRLSSLIVAVLAGFAGFCGCESTDDNSGTLTREVGVRDLAELSTSQLKVRRAEVLKHYAEIQRDVELKAGLPMGVAIKDDRALLGELYREAHEIERELLRRFSRGDPEVSMEQVKLTGKW